MDKNKEMVPDSCILVRQRKSIDHCTLFMMMVFSTSECLQKSRAAGREYKGEEILKGTSGLDCEMNLNFMQALVSDAESATVSMC